MLNRPSATIRMRYKFNLLNPHSKIGLWTIHEDALILECFFKDNQDSCPQLIKSVSFKDLDEISRQLNRSQANASKHWMSILRPALLAYHYDCLFKSFKPEFCRYLIKKKVRANQDIDWREVENKFPSENSFSFNLMLNTELKKCKRNYPSMEHEPLYVKLQFFRSDWNNVQFPARVKKYRSQIVKLYDQIRGVAN